MHYEEQSRRLNILGGFVLGIAAGVSAGFLLFPGRRGPSGSDAVRRARALRGHTGRRLQGPATLRMARTRFAL